MFNVAVLDAPMLMIWLWALAFSRLFAMMIVFPDAVLSVKKGPFRLVEQFVTHDSVTFPDHKMP